MRDSQVDRLSRAGMIEGAVISAQGQQWEVWFYGDDIPSHMRNVAQLQDGQRRTFSTIDSAYAWVAQTVAGSVEVRIDGRRTLRAGTSAGAAASEAR